MKNARFYLDLFLVGALAIEGSLLGCAYLNSPTVQSAEKVGCLLLSTIEKNPLLGTVCATAVEIQSAVAALAPVGPITPETCAAKVLELRAKDAGAP